MLAVKGIYDGNSVQFLEQIDMEKPYPYYGYICTTCRRYSHIQGEGGIDCFGELR